MEIERSRLQSLPLPDEIIDDILSRLFILPVKSLLRFRCISKSWRSLIGSKSFIKTQHQNSMKNPCFPHQRLIIQKNCSGVPYSMDWPEQCSLQSVLSGPINTIPLSLVAYPTNTTAMGYEIVGSCNGLVCLLEMIKPNRIQLWNPSTRISKILPEISSPGKVSNIGFGWVESSDEYKVFVHLYDTNYYQDGKIYSSKTKSWKTIEPCYDLFSYCCDGVFAGGKLYWKIKYGDAIFFLDLKSEVFGRIEIPFDQEMFGEIDQEIYGDSELEKYGVVGVLGGFLCVLCFDYQIRGFRVWVMKESWEKVETLSHLLELLQPPLVKGLNGEILVNCGSIVVVYDCRDNVFRSLKYCSCCHVVSRLWGFQQPL
ncbi:F-box/kelch-repeat protein At3g06240-like [Salvia miltiorrhiza]|uniref:F-box/kelch-repeat protein At3g06240-like n=1 Tax=Salvia miltiorrhiza TaxID=226208 RepID=UPI0025AC773B|nr:F-box/kelch-repeat protein At3g06240-like [Salvia miltiorrhiza]